MGVYRRGKTYWIDLTIHGARYRQSAGTSDRREALAREKELVAAICAGKVAASTGRAYARLPFDGAAEQYLGDRAGRVAERTHELERELLKPLRRFFAGRILAKIAAEDIAAYQRKRREEGVSGRTANMEVGTLRKMLKRAKRWSLLADDVTFYPERSNVARVLTPEEKATLFRTAASRDEWLVACCAAVLAVNTTCRSIELKTLRWRYVDLFGKIMTIRRSKTDAGLRVIPLNSDAATALARLRQRSEALSGQVQPEHFVFPACENHRIDPTRPQKTWRTAWRSLTEEAGLKGLRFHDLRHQAITELSEAGAPDATLMALAGHLSREMLEHYSHVRMAAKREAVEKLACGLLTEPPAPIAVPAAAGKVN